MVRSVLVSDGLCWSLMVRSVLVSDGQVCVGLRWSGLCWSLMDMPNVKHYSNDLYDQGALKITRAAYR